jgi:hypothetical protein
LIPILLLTLNSFSQTDTTKVKIPTNIARLVVKDLILGDSCFEELKLTQLKLVKIQERETQKDAIISLYKEKDENNMFIINQKDLQINQYEKLTDDLYKELKYTKRSTIFWKMITGVAIVVSVMQLVK